MVEESWTWLWDAKVMEDQKALRVMVDGGH